MLGRPRTMAIRRTTLACLFAAGTLQAAAEAQTAVRAGLHPASAQLPLYFVSNAGQSPSRVRFAAHGPGYELFLAENETLLVVRDAITGTPATVRMRFDGGNSQPVISGDDQLRTRVNYFIGRDSAKWRANVPAYGTVRLANVYDGIDAVFYGRTRRQLEFDLVVSPGADPRAIAMRFEGTSSIRIDANGDLVLRAAGRDLRFERPVVYQEANGKRHPIDARYVVGEGSRVRFELGRYDKGEVLIIDPVLTLAYSTLLGGSEPTDAAMTSGRAIAVDSSGNAFVAGYSNSIDFPQTGGVANVTHAFVAKLDPTGSMLLYATYFGGLTSDGTIPGGATTSAMDVSIDTNGRAYVVGGTNTTDFPTVGAFQPSAGGGGQDGFVTVLDPTGGSLLYSSYIGGGSLDGAKSVALVATNVVYVVGRTESSDFPTKNARQSQLGEGDAFVIKLDTSAAGTDSVLYSTYLGGAGYDEAAAVATDAAGNAYIAGSAGEGFPEVNPLITPVNLQGDAFVAQLDPSGATLIYSTLLGGATIDWASAIAVDSLGYVYVAGTTTSSNFPVINAYQQTRAGGGDAFIAKLDPRATGDAALLYSTYLGGNESGNADEGLSLAVDAVGNATVLGYTESPNFPVFSDVWAADDELRFRSGTVFLARLSPVGQPGFLTRFGGESSQVAIDVAIDGSDNIYLTGEVYVTGGATTFPVTPGAFQPAVAHDTLAAFIVKIGVPADMAITDVFPTTLGNGGDAVITFRGYGFAAGATVRLVMAGQPDIVGRVRSPNPNVLSVLFDLRGKATGGYDVVITNPDGTTFTPQDSIQLEDARAADMWVDVIGPPRIRGGVPATFSVLFGNRGNNVASGVLLKIAGIPNHVHVDLDADLSTWLPPELEPFRMDVDPVIKTADGQALSIFVGLVPNGVVGTLRLRLTSLAGPGDELGFTLKAGISEPYFGSPIHPLAEACVQALTDALVAEIVAGLIDLVPGAGCLLGIAQAAAAGLENFVANASDLYAGDMTVATVMTNFGGVLAALLNAQIGCAADLAGIILPQAQIVEVLLDVISKIPAALDVLEACQAEDEAAHPTGEGSAADPNTKIGATGAGVERYINGSEPLRYTVYFENLPTATAPARDVVITDQLDPMTMDVSTFSLGPVAFGDKVVSPPPNAKVLTTDVDLRPGQDLVVRVTATLDMTTGVLTYNFNSLDPATGLPPSDPLAGFLPPDVVGGEGQGNVTFTLNPKAGLPTGTTILNSARIVFDANDPIDTPAWVNTIDSVTPASSVRALPPATSTTPLIVEWSGTDDGAGIEHFTVYVSEDGGPFTLLTRNTTATSAMMPVTLGHSYAFYSIARDAAGNEEARKTAAEALTTIVPPDTTPPSIAPEITGTLGSGGWYTSAVTVNWSLSDPETGIASTAGCGPVTLTGDTSGTMLTCTATNGVSLSNQMTATIKIDATGPAIVPPPTQTAVQTSPDGAAVHYPAPQITETGSGLASSVCAPASGAVFAVGTTSVICTATDQAGNVSRATFPVIVNLKGWMLGGGYIQSGRVKWHFAFNASEDDRHLESRLTVWLTGAAGGRFVATSMTAVFSDDPAFGPGTGATVDTVSLRGSGVWNGQAGYTFQSVATQRGGRFGERDTFSIVIRDSRGAIVAGVDGTLTGGAIQSLAPR